MKATFTASFLLLVLATLSRAGDYTGAGYVYTRNGPLVGAVVSVAFTYPDGHGGNTVTTVIAVTDRTGFYSATCSPFGYTGVMGLGASTPGGNAVGTGLSQPGAAAFPPIIVGGP